MTGEINDPTTQHQDVITAFQYMRPASIDWDAYKFLTPPYRSMFLFSGEPLSEWTAPTEDELLDHLLQSWTPVEVGAYLARRAQHKIERLMRADWEASFRGRVTLRYRSIRNEVRERVRESWKILRHGVEEEY